MAGLRIKVSQSGAVDENYLIKGKTLTYPTLVEETGTSCEENSRLVNVRNWLTQLPYFLVIAGKILAKILANRLASHAVALLPESQCGVRTNKGTTDMIFKITARQLQEKCRE